MVSAVATMVSLSANSVVVRYRVNEGIRVWRARAEVTRKSP